MNFLYGRLPINPSLIGIPFVPTIEPLLDTVDQDLLDTVDQPLLDTGE